MESGDILGHEFMGEVVETGRDVKNLKKGDRVVVPFPIACGQCFFCQQGPDFRMRELESQRLGRGNNARPLRSRACSAIRTCWAAMPEGRRNTLACPSRT